MNPKDISLKLTANERTILSVLEESNAEELQKATGLSEIEVMRAVQWLQNKGLARVTKEETTVVVLGTLGRDYAKKKLPELQLLKEITKDTALSELFKIRMDQKEISAALGKLNETKTI